MYFLAQKLYYLAAVTCPKSSKVDGLDTGLPTTCASSDTLKTVLQIVFGVIAVMAVIYIILAAIRYATSLGDPQATAKLRGSIIYAMVGLIIALSAEVIVTFVLGRI